MNDRERLQKALDALTEQGYETHARWWCCNRCGVAALRDDTTKFVFWHEQSDMAAFSVNPDKYQYGSTSQDRDEEEYEEPEDAWVQYNTLRQPLYLNWDGDGHLIKMAFHDQGFETEWDGNPERKIAILPRR